MEELEKKIPVAYRRSEDYRLLPVTGAVVGGGLNSPGTVIINLYVDSTPIPEAGEITVKGLDVTETWEGRDVSILREVLVGLHLSAPHAIAIGEFIASQGKNSLEQLKTAQDAHKVIES